MRVGQTPTARHGRRGGLPGSGKGLAIAGRGPALSGVQQLACHAEFLSYSRTATVYR